MTGNSLVELERIKAQLFPTVREELAELDVEIVDEGNDITPTGNNSSIIVTNASTITKDDLINDLIELNQATSEIIEHVKEIVLSELPESQKITETSKLITAKMDIIKSMYEIKFKDADEINKDTKKEFNSKMIKELIEAVKNKTN